MGVGQIRPVVKCRAPHRAVRRIPRGKGEKRREVPLPPRDCAAASPIPCGGKMRAELRATTRKTLRHRKLPCAARSSAPVEES